MNGHEPTPEQTVLTLRVVVGALAVGIAAFGAVAVFIVSSGPLGGDTEVTLLLGVLALLALGLAAAYPVLAKVKMAELRRRYGSEALAGGSEVPAGLLQEYATLTILKAAFVEGPSLFALVIFLLSGSPWALAAAAAGLVLLLSMFPSQERLRVFAERARGRPG